MSGELAAEVAALKQQVLDMLPDSEARMQAIEDRADNLGSEWPFLNLADESNYGDGRPFFGAVYLGAGNTADAVSMRRVLVTDASIPQWLKDGVADAVFKSQEGYSYTPPNPFAGSKMASRWLHEIEVTNPSNANIMLWIAQKVNGMYSFGAQAIASDQAVSINCLGCDDINLMPEIVQANKVFISGNVYNWKNHTFYLKVPTNGTTRIWVSNPILTAGKLPPDKLVNVLRLRGAGVLPTSSLYSPA